MHPEGVANPLCTFDIVWTNGLNVYNKEMKYRHLARCRSKCSPTSDWTSINTNRHRDINMHADVQEHFRRVSNMHCKHTHSRIIHCFIHVSNH
jgi:hypothetical protein